MKLNLKGIDFKGFMLEKGERVVLGIAAVVMALMLFWNGYKTAFGGSGASANAAKIADLSAKAEQAMTSSQPTADVADPPKDLADAKVVMVDRDWFPCDRPYFSPHGQIDRKWREPKVLAPDDFTASVVKGAVQTYNLDRDADGNLIIAVLQSKVTKDNLNAILRFMQQHKQYKRAVARFGLPQGMVPAPGRGGPPGAGAPGAGRGGAGKFQALSGPGGGGAGAGRPEPGAKGEMELKWVREDQLAQEAGKATLAKTVVPTRMLIATGAFPWKQQLEEFRKALRRDRVEDIWDDPDGWPEFVGVEVQRRVLGPNGNVEKDWEDIDLQKSLRELRVRAIGIEPEDVELYRLGVIVRPNRLVVSRPKLTRHQNYPDSKPQSIEETVAAIKKAITPEQVIVTPELKRRFNVEDADIFNDAEEAVRAAAPEGAPGQAPGQAPVPGLPAAVEQPGGGGGGGEGDGVADVPGGGGAQVMSKGRNRAPALAAAPGLPAALKSQEITPDKIMLRFIDVTVEPGKSYEYRVKIKMVNPCWRGGEEKAVARSLTEHETIETADWAVVTSKSNDQDVPLRVTVPDELLYYAVDETQPGAPAPPANPERAAIQIHRWLERARLNPSEQESTVPVGDWAVLQRLLVHRGEYIGRLAEAEVPVWRSAIDNFTLAVQPEERVRLRNGQFGNRKHRGVYVDFQTDPLYDSGSVLVDFDGGKRTVKVDDKNVTEEAPMEMLVLGADGKLIIHDSRVDSADPERHDRVARWEKELREVRQATEKAKGVNDPMFQNKMMPGGAGRGGGGGGGGGGDG
jgi:hypothetical protein